MNPRVNPKLLSVPDIFPLHLLSFRVVRLPVFLRNVLAVWRYFEANRHRHKRL